MSLQARERGRCIFCAFETSARLRFSSNARFYSFTAMKDRSLSQTTHEKVWSPGQSKRSTPKTSGFRKSVDRSDVAIKSPRQRNDATFGFHRPLRGFTVNPADRANGTKRLDIEETTYGVFGRLLLEKHKSLAWTLQHNAAKYELEAWGIFSEEDLDARLDVFRERIEQCIALAEDGQSTTDGNPLFSRFRRAFVAGGVNALSTDIRFAFINFVIEEKFTTQDITNQDKLADIRHPFEWYPATRAMHRTIHLHVGPTNSGKTYHALKRLEAAKTGIYAGPLRLLAHEVYTRFNAKGKSCALITGEERRIPEDGDMNISSCTVEMIPLNKQVDVAVIDEIQMMGDIDRGWAWTQGFLGVQAKEVHLCGELRTIQLVSDICAATGDKLVIHKYERLSPLASERRSLEGDLTKLKKGDAIIIFSRVGIHAMKADVERVTGKRCAVVYGSLPPETRAQQAELFNNPDNDYDFLVASDAVGMGLNLSIKRVIFESVSKHDGTSFRVIKPWEIKQIGGRAGRYKTAHHAVNENPSENLQAKGPVSTEADTTNGLVTTLERFDLSIVQKAMNLEVESMKTAGIAPPASVLLRFANYFPKGTAFSYITLRLWDVCKLGDLFHMCQLKEQVLVADLIEPYPLSAMDRITFMAAPVALREQGFKEVVQEFAECVATQSGGELLDLKTLNLELIDMDKDTHWDGSKGYLRAIETLHKALTLYLWLSYRFAGVFRSQALAFHAKGLVEDKINECLAEVQFDNAKKKQLSKLRKRALELDLAEQEAARQAREGLGMEDSVVDEDKNENEGTPSHALDDDVPAVEEVEYFDDERDSPASKADVSILPTEPSKTETIST